MIISASRRTDIPAFYGDWLLRRLREGEALIQNPYDARRLGHVRLTPDVVDCIVFWTKNPGPMLDKLAAITALGHLFYFQFTLTPYGPDVERSLPSKPLLVTAFKELSDILGPQRVVWRYDPILVDAAHPPSWHVDAFNRLCAELYQYTDSCIISFMDSYAHLPCPQKVVQDADVLHIVTEFAAIARHYGLTLATCGEHYDLCALGIGHASCIDQIRIEYLLGQPLQASRDKKQRPACRCAESVDIGSYNSCPHGCVYCYATSHVHAMYRNLAQHHVDSPLLIGTPREDALITERTRPSCKVRQLRL